MNKVFSLLVLVNSANWVSAQETIYCSAPYSGGATVGSWSNKCTPPGRWTQWYNPAYGTCCSSGVVWAPKVLSAAEIATSGCCEYRFCDRATQICCDFGDDPVVYDVPAGVDAASATCCAGQVIDGSTKQCCNNQISESRTCCGSGPLGMDQICCSGQAFDNPDKLLDCCGSTTYDSTKQVCCDGTPQDFANDGDPTKNECCGSEVYDSAADKCCFVDGEPSIKDIEDPSCCGVGTFDETVDKCCFGFSVNVTGSVTGDDPNNAECCGLLSVIDNTMQFCCNGTGADLDTDNGADKDNAVCCTGDSGTIAIDGENKFCCDGEGVDLDATSMATKDNAVCCSGESTDTTAINGETYLCCNGAGVEIPSEVEKANAECCGPASVRDITKEVCCGDPGDEEPVEFDPSLIDDPSTAKCCDNDATKACCSDGFTDITPDGPGNKCPT